MLMLTLKEDLIIPAGTLFQEELFGSYGRADILERDSCNYVESMIGPRDGVVGKIWFEVSPLREGRCGLDFRDPDVNLRRENLLATFRVVDGPDELVKTSRTEVEEYLRSALNGPEMLQDDPKEALRIVTIALHYKIDTDLITAYLRMRVDEPKNPTHK